MYSIKTPDGTFPLSVVSSSDIPSIYISTDSGSLTDIHADKAYKEEGNASLVDESGVSFSCAELEYIKGRGNSSWRSNEKRSYTIKFDEKRSLLGMKAAKKWALTSNNMDVTLLRNAIAYKAAQLTSIPYTVSFVYVDLFINGCYRGNYLFCEKIEVDENRVNISDLGKENERVNPNLDYSNIKTNEKKSNGLIKKWADVSINPQDISGGYLLEYDYLDELQTHFGGFTTKAGSCLVFHDPKYPTQAEVDYVTNLYLLFEEALLSKTGYNKSGKSFLDYIDLASFVDGALIYELTGDQDDGCTSWYIFLPKGSDKFYMGPVWDFDQGMDDPSVTLSCVKALARRELNMIKAEKNMPISFLELLFSHSEFVQAIAERLSDLSVSFEGSLNNWIHKTAKKCQKAFYIDSIRWGYTVSQKKDIELLDYVLLRTETMRQTFSDLDTSVQNAKETLKQNSNTSNNRIVLTSLICIGSCSVVCMVFAATMLIRKRKKVKKPLDNHRNR